MSTRIGVLTLLMAVFLLSSTSADAQSCNPAAVSYIVRDEQGSVIGGEELKRLAAKELWHLAGDAGGLADEELLHRRHPLHHAEA